SENEIEPRARDMSLFKFLIHLPCLGQGWLIPGIDSCRAMPIVRLSITLTKERRGLQRLSLLLEGRGYMMDFHDMSEKMLTEMINRIEVQWFQ
ncbi:hypothetical protein ACJX0J_000375, partial (mitochondrion) [Zea mays]